MKTNGKSLFVIVVALAGPTLVLVQVRKAAEEDLKGLGLCGQMNGIASIKGISSGMGQEDKVSKGQGGVG